MRQRFRSLAAAVGIVAVLSAACSSSGDRKNRANTSTAAVDSSVAADSVAADSVAADSVAAETVARTTTASDNAGVFKGSWQGTVEGTDAFIGLVSDGLEFTAYVCDSKTLSAWFRGAISRGTGALVNADGAKLQVTFDANAATGTFAGLDGPARSFRAVRAERAVLYRAENVVDGNAVLGGWILGAGDQRGLVTLAKLPIASPVLVVPEFDAAALSKEPSAAPTAPTHPTDTASPLAKIGTADTGPPGISTMTPPPATAVGSAAPASPEPGPVVVASPAPGIPPLIAIPVTPDQVVAPKANTSGFGEFVFVAMGDSYGSGEGNPPTPLSNPLRSNAALRDLLPVVTAGGSTATNAIGGLRPGGPLGAALRRALSQLVGATAAGPALIGTGERPFVDNSSTFVTNWGGNGADADRCHRSGQSGAAKTAAALQQQYSGRVNVRLVSFACSGARAENLTHVAQAGVDPQRRVPPQIDQLRAFLIAEGIDHVDALYVSVGGNDGAFGAALVECAFLPDPRNCNTTDLPARVANGVRTLSNAYARLNDRVQELVELGAARVPDRVYISHYPNPTRGDDATTLCQGAPDGPLKNDTLGFLSAAEAQFAEDMVLQFNRAISDAVTVFAPTSSDSRRGAWRLVKFSGDNDGQSITPVLRDDFSTHGVCSNRPFVNNGAAALSRQGPDLANVVDAGGTPVLQISAGVMHPNDAGYTAYKDRMLPLFKAQIDEMIAARPNAPARLRQVSAGANQSITIRWDDKADNESKYVVYARPLTPADVSSIGPSLRIGVQLEKRLALPTPFTKVGELGGNAQEFTHPNDGVITAEYMVVACTRFDRCSVPVDPAVVSITVGGDAGPTVVATNTPTAVPTP